MYSVVGPTVVKDAVLTEPAHICPLDILFVLKELMRAVDKKDVLPLRFPINAFPAEMKFTFKLLVFAEATKELPAEMKFTFKLLVFAEATKELPAEIKFTFKLLVFAEATKELPAEIKFTFKLLVFAEATKELPAEMKFTFKLLIFPPEANKFPEEMKFVLSELINPKSAAIVPAEIKFTFCVEIVLMVSYVVLTTVTLINKLLTVILAAVMVPVEIVLALNCFVVKFVSNPSTVLANNIFALENPRRDV